MRTTEDQDLLRAGIFNELEGKETTGRSVIFYHLGRQAQHSTSDRVSLVRALWFVLHESLKNETSQKMGVIFMSFPNGLGFLDIDWKLDKMIIESIQGCLPIRVSVIHICHPPVSLSIVFPILKFLMGERLWRRVYLHNGSTTRTTTTGEQQRRFL